MNDAQTDPLDKLKRDIGYAEVPEDGDGGGIDALIDYKNALEDEIGRLGGQIASERHDALSVLGLPGLAADLLAGQTPEQVLDHLGKWPFGEGNAAELAIERQAADLLSRWSNPDA